MLQLLSSEMVFVETAVLLGLGWAGLGWAGLVTTQPSCCCLAAEAGKELATTKPNYLAVDNAI